jgi:hypothetical protein
MTLFSLLLSYYYLKKGQFKMKDSEIPILKVKFISDDNMLRLYPTHI